MRLIPVFILLITHLFTQAQSTCETAEFTRLTSVKTDSALNENWYKIRAKGNLLNFEAKLQNQDSVDYQIFPFKDCHAIEHHHITPIRSVIKGQKIITDEVWNNLINNGVCVCPTCIQRIELKHQGALQVEQGEFYLIRVIANNQPFEIEMQYDDIDTLHPIQFDLDSVNAAEMEVGMVYQLRDIFFVPAKAVYLEKSIPELKQLKSFLEKHEVIKIQVRGHVNGPAQTKPSFYQSLSDDRAKAIQKFLIEAGIEKERIDIKGMSNFQMRYPSPKTPFEAAENRRVEIVITAVN